jgi:hypothetical protein
MTQHREIENKSSYESGGTPGGLSASYVDLLKTQEGTKAGDRAIAQNGDFLSFNGDQVVSQNYGRTDFLSSPVRTAVDQTAFLTPQIKIGTAYRLDGKSLI